MGDVGTVRRHRDGRYYLDFGPKLRIWSLPIGDARIGFDHRLAHRTLELIRGKLSENPTRSLDDVIAAFLPANAEQNCIGNRLDRWLEVKQSEADAGDRSPYYVRQLRLARKGPLSWWDATSIHDVTYADLEDWSVEMAEHGKGPKTRKNMIGYFRSFMGWLYDREEIRELPRKWPIPKVPEYEPTTLSPATVNAILAAISDEERGIFLAMARLGLRTGEARALDATAYRDGWMMIAKAVKGGRRDDPIRGTKTGRWRKLPVQDDLRAWINKHVPAESRLERRPLFPNPNTGGRWVPTSLRRVWHNACAAAGVPHIKLYEGTRHSAATEWKRQGADDRTLQKILGHADRRSVERYARLSDDAVVEVLRPRSG